MLPVCPACGHSAVPAGVHQVPTLSCEGVTFCQTPVVPAEQPPAGVAQTLALPPPPQVSVPVHTPQESVELHPSAMVPQLAPCAEQVVGVQAVPVPQTLALPPAPQVSVPWQAPQLRVPPQPSGSVPQFFPRDWQVAGVQAEAPSGAASPTGGVAPPSLVGGLGPASGVGAVVPGCELQAKRRVDARARARRGVGEWAGRGRIAGVVYARGVPLE